MKERYRRWFGAGWLCLALSLAAATCAPATDTLVWRQGQDRVDADISSWELPKLLQTIAADTGWRVYLQPDTARHVSAKFKNLSAGDALHSLLGGLNFAVVPQTNAPSKLFVFRTSMQEATQLIRARKHSGAGAAKPIPNELVVSLKPGAKMSIEELARSVGAKVIGRIDGLDAYRLKFADEAAAQAARSVLASNSDVGAVDSNFPVNNPPTPQAVTASSVPDISLKPKAPPAGSHGIIVGLIDTPVQTLGNNLDSFLLPAINVTDVTQPLPQTPLHGSTMAPTILKAIAAVTSSTSVKILPVNVYGNSSTTTTFQVAQGIYQAVNAGANPINLSLGSGGDSSLLHSVIQSAYDQGVVFFAAAGNEPVTTATYPAAYPEVVAVTASGPNGQIASYANRGSFVDMMAPGSNVFDFGSQAYYVSGTSVSTAYVSGLAAGAADSANKTIQQVEPSIQNSLSFDPGGAGSGE